MAKKNEKWIQKAVSRMEKKGTVGSFTEYCGGKITAECVEKALNSPDPKIRKKAQFYVNVTKKELGGLLKYAMGGSVMPQNQTSLTDTVGVLNSIYGPAGADALFNTAMQKADELYNLSTTAAKYGLRVYADGGRIYFSEEGMEVPIEQPATSQNVQQQAQQPQQAAQISYEQYVAFVTQYPSYLDRFLNELNQQIQNMEEQGEQQEQPMMNEGGEIMGDGDGGGNKDIYGLLSKTGKIRDRLYASGVQDPNQMKEMFYTAVKEEISPNLSRKLTDRMVDEAFRRDKKDKIGAIITYLESVLTKNAIKEEGGEMIGKG